MKQAFISKKFSTDTLLVIQRANQIIAQYQAAGYRMTLRQLYYQFVSKNWLANTEQNYKRLGSILNDARYAGEVDWSAIEDRNRQPHHTNEYTDLEQLARAALSSYRLDRWKNQPIFVELWVEKAALAGVLQPLADEWHVTLMVNRGYSSASAMFEASERFNARGVPGVVLYLGDHDPSGEDMVRDISKRFEIFGSEVTVEKVALTMAQIQQYNPPPNPAKRTDSRFEAYEAKHGSQSWEVDALPPNVLADLIHDAMRQHIKESAMRKVLANEKMDKNAFARALKQAMGGKARLDGRCMDIDTPPFTI